MKRCEASGCLATAIGMVVFQGKFVDRGPGGNVTTFPTWPWQWRCFDHSRGEGRGLTPEIWQTVRDAIEKRTGKKLSGLDCGLSTLTEEQVDKLRFDATKGLVERLPDPVSATFVSMEEMREILSNPNLRC